MGWRIDGTNTKESSQKMHAVLVFLWTRTELPIRARHLRVVHKIRRHRQAYYAARRGNEQSVSAANEVQ